MLEILTPLTKVERVSRQIDSATFVAAPGIWAQIQEDGSLLNVVETTNALINKLVIGSASLNQYESHDIEVGRITTMESFGVRCKVDSEGFTGTPTQGEFLIVSSAAKTLGKLAPLSDGVSKATYEIVARCEEIDSTNSIMVFRTISPTVVTMA